MIYRSPDMGGFEFVKLSALRTAQLMRGCIPRVPVGSKPTTTALREVADGKVIGLPRDPVNAPRAGVA
jgi:DNA-directed RNA polymerase subunit K/omega